jgi:hypothetical protein
MFELDIVPPQSLAGNILAPAMYSNLQISIDVGAA